MVKVKLLFALYINLTVTYNMSQVLFIYLFIYHIEKSWFLGVIIPKDYRLLMSYSFHNPQIVDFCNNKAQCNLDFSIVTFQYTARIRALEDVIFVLVLGSPNILHISDGDSPHQDTWMFYFSKVLKMSKRDVHYDPFNLRIVFFRFLLIPF